MNCADEVRGRLVGAVFRAMQSKAFVAAFQDRRVLGTITDVLSLRARARLAARQVGGGVARAFGLATLDDLHDLERQIRAGDRRPRAPAEPRD
jgi:hypothetical protein